MNQTLDEILNELMMSTSFGAHFVVEGDSDRKFFHSMFKVDSLVNVVPVNGSENVLGLMQLYQSSGQKFPVLGIIDRDYRPPLETLPSCGDVELTDMRDVECMMFGSDALKAVIEAFGSRDKVRAFGGLPVVRERLLNAARQIGYMRFYSQKAGLHLKFSDMEFSRFIDSRDIIVDVDKMLDHISSKQNPRIRLAKSDHEKAVLETSQALHDGLLYFSDDLLLCSGHDLVEILSVGLRRAIGTCRDIDVRRESLERVFRVGYIAHFKSSKMFARICAWINSKTGLKLSAVWL